MIKRLLLGFLLLAPKLLCAQSYEKEFVALFAWEVKQMDEFVERFNNSDSTMIREYEQKHNPSAPLTRERLIKSLFNSSRADWNFNDIKDFIKQVNDKEKPVYLDFYNDNWFANLNCAVTWDGKPQNVMLKLKIEKHADGSFKWVIEDARFLSAKGEAFALGNNGQPVLPQPVSNTASLNPMSHATDFFNIDKVTSDSKNLSNYLTRAGSYSNDFCVFINGCLNNHLKVLHVNNITYTCLQVKGWDMEIQQYNRQTKNSGWLISKLIKLPS